MRKVLLSIIATLALATSIGYWSLSSEKQGFTVKQHWFEQSKYPLQEQSDTFKQQLLILTPQGLSHLPTPSFTAVLNILMPTSACDWVNGQILSKAPFNASQRNWYTWKYQQCNELGTFFTGYPFSNSQQTYTERCNESFGFSPRPVNAQNWQLDRLIPEINKPLIIVAGGKDPWINVGIKPNHTFKNIKYLYSDDWFHCPDRDNTEAGLQTFSELRKALLTKTRI